MVFIFLAYFTLYYGLQFHPSFYNLLFAFLIIKEHVIIKKQVIQNVLLFCFFTNQWVIQLTVLDICSVNYVHTYIYRQKLTEHSA